MNWSVFTRRQKQMVLVTIIMAVLLIVLMVHFLGLTKPASERGGAAKQEILDLQGKIENARNLLIREAGVNKDLKEVVQRLEALSVHVPSLSDRYAWTYEYVSRCATQSQVVLDNLEEILVTGDAAGNPDKPYEISISTRCGYNRLVEFLRRLETGNPLLKIKQITIDAMPDSPEASQVRIIMQWPASIKIERGAK
ncbi:MAG: hypothetical protein MUC65_00200 [Pontiellaceae bacterium]|jgi:hypothetical protein|nr:hypothetical protein [Pontiellaceae bacterium]